MLATRSRARRAAWFPLGEQGKDATRSEARRRRPRRRRPGREPGGLLPRRRRLPRVPRAAGLDRRAGADPRHRGQGARPPRRASGVSRPASAAGSASSTTGPLYALRTDPSANTVVVGPRSALERTTRPAGAAGCMSPATESTRSFATARPPSRPRWSRPADGFDLGSTSRSSPSRRARRRFSTRRTRSWARASSPRPLAAVRYAPCRSQTSRPSTSSGSSSASSSSSAGSPSAYLLLRLSDARLTLLLQGVEASVIPIVTRVREPSIE